MSSNSPESPSEVHWFRANCCSLANLSAHWLVILYRYLPVLLLRFLGSGFEL